MLCSASSLNLLDRLSAYQKDLLYSISTVDHPPPVQQAGHEAVACRLMDAMNTAAATPVIRQFQQTRPSLAGCRCSATAHHLIDLSYWSIPCAVCMYDRDLTLSTDCTSADVLTQYCQHITFARPSVDLLSVGLGRHGQQTPRARERPRYPPVCQPASQRGPCMPWPRLACPAYLH